MSGAGHAVLLGECTMIALRRFMRNVFWCSTGLVNSFVHMIMYGYYFLTSFKPELKQSIWWKKYITQVQMAQFTILIFHFGIPVFTDCSFSKFLSAGIALQNLFMLVLFADFYFKAYLKKKNWKAKRIINRFITVYYLDRSLIKFVIDIEQRNKFKNSIKIQNWMQ